MFKKLFTRKRKNNYINNINDIKIKPDEPHLDNHILEFTNGSLKSCDGIPIYSYSGNYYISTNYIIDGKYYNLCNINDIISIPNNIVRDDNCDLTKQIEYLLYMASGVLDDNNMLLQSIECLRKSNHLKVLSHFEYSYKDYMRVCIKLVENGMFKEAEIEREYWKSIKPDLFSRKLYQLKSIHKAIAAAMYTNTDLLVMTSHSSSCALCSKFENIVFSISGTNKKYPKLPETVKKIGAIHVGCQHIFFPFYDDIESVSQDVETLNKYVDELDSQDIDYDSMFAKYDIDHQYEDRIEYYKLFYKYPELAPKSFNAYRRMKNNKTTGYLSIIEKLKAIDIVFYNNNFN